MSVLISNIEMPTSCAECVLNYDCFKCIVTGTPFFDHEHHFDDETTRLDNCPLVPVPEHGDLIDRDALLNSVTTKYGWFEVDNEDVKNAPAIIPASGGKENE